MCDNTKLLEGELHADGIVYIEYGKKKVETVYKGYSKKFSTKHRVKPETTKRFDNQVTIVYRTKLTPLTYGLPDIICMMNTKIFKNGNIQMTGIRSIEQGKEMVNNIVKMILNIHKNGESNIVTNIDNIRCNDYKLRLINSDFRIGYDVRREQLFKLLVDNYNICCSFEPCIYPAVKIKYYFNEENQLKDGLCKCSKKCIIGKGSGCGDKLCKKVTIAVFQSGCIIITGGQSIDQVNEAYRFITKTLSDNIDNVKKQNILIPSAGELMETVLIKTVNIKKLC